MNKIQVKSNTQNKKIKINEDTIVYYENCNCNIIYEIENEVKIFECVINSKVNNTYNIEKNIVLNIFSVNSNINIDINLNKEGIILDYAYSTLNENNNEYIINVNHNKQNQKSKIVNHGINLESNKLNFIINAVVPKESTNIITNQDSKIIALKDNNSKIKPNLLIDNYDVEANHSAYVGDFKSNDIFYLTSRGITLEMAKKLLAKSFLIGNMNISFREIDIILTNLDKYWR